MNFDSVQLVLEQAVSACRRQQAGIFLGLGGAVCAFSVPVLAAVASWNSANGVLHVSAGRTDRRAVSFHHLQKLHLPDVLDPGSRIRSTERDLANQSIIKSRALLLPGVEVNTSVRPQVLTSGWSGRTGRRAGYGSR